jgi:hypothetical protein
MDEPDWRIRVDRSGGFAGINISGEVRSSELSAQEAEELDRLATAVDFNESSQASGQPDRFQYSLVVDHGTDHYELSTDEGSMSTALKELVRWVTPRLQRSSPATS